MFFEPGRLSLVQDMILAVHQAARGPEDTVEKTRYDHTLEELERLQVQDFEDILRVMDGRPVVIRRHCTSSCPDMTSCWWR